MDNPVSAGFLTKKDLDDSLDKARQYADAASLERARGIKYYRPVRLYGTPNNGTVVLGTNYPVSAPAAGYAWSIMRLASSGLGTGTSPIPDILNIYRNGTNVEPVWQLNGNNWGYTFGLGELVLTSGEILMAASVGSMVSTSQITLTADVIEVPQEMLGKLMGHG